MNEYQSKNVVRFALEVTTSMKIEKINEFSSTLSTKHLGPGVARKITFKHYTPVETGDFIVYLTEKDTYHCKRDVFLKKNIVPGVNDIDPPVDDIVFGDAIKWLQMGHKITRRSWNDPARFIYLVPQNLYFDTTNNSGIAVGGLVPYAAYFAMIDPINDCVVVWTPTADDCLTNDWQVLKS